MLFAPLAHAAIAMGRLDQAIAGHPLLPAFLHRLRLDAVRRQAAVDGRSIDSWQLAAVLEGLRPRLDAGLRIADRGAILDAARFALGLYGWLVTPDAEQSLHIRQASRHLEGASTGVALLTAGSAMHSWIDQGGARAPMRAAIIRFWQSERVLQAALPITGACAFTEEAPWARDLWVAAFLEGVAAEAGVALTLLGALDRAWRAARAQAGGQRRTSRARAAIDILAAAPLVSATTLAASLGMSVKSACVLLDGFVARGVAVEVTHRHARRLYGLAELAPLRAGVQPPARPEPGRGPGRPRNQLSENVIENVANTPSSVKPCTPVDWSVLDFTDLDRAMAHVDEVTRETRRQLDQLRIEN